MHDNIQVNQVVNEFKHQNSFKMWELSEDSNLKKKLEEDNKEGEKKVLELHDNMHII